MPHAVMSLAAIALVGTTESPARSAAVVAPEADRAMAWPKGLDPAHADVFDHNELLIETGCDVVYRRLADPADWPSWLIFARDVRLGALGGAPHAGTRFSWTIFGTPISSVVYVAEQGRRFGYTNTPPGPPPRYAQSWTMKPLGKGCLVTTEEVGVGTLARATSASGDRQVHVAHDLWLASLRWASMFQHH